MYIASQLSVQTSVHLAFHPWTRGLMRQSQPISHLLQLQTYLNGGIVQEEDELLHKQQRQINLFIFRL